MQAELDLRHQRGIEMHMHRAMVPKCFVIDKEHPFFGTEVHSEALIVRLAPKTLSFFGRETTIPDPRAVKKVEELQAAWETGTTSFGALLFFPKGTQEYTVEWAMVHPLDFMQDEEQLLDTMKRVKEDGHDLQARSLEFIYTALFEARPPGDGRPGPLTKLPSF